MSALRLRRVLKPFSQSSGMLGYFAFPSKGSGVHPHAADENGIVLFCAFFQFRAPSGASFGVSRGQVRHQGEPAQFHLLSIVQKLIGMNRGPALDTSLVVVGTLAPVFDSGSVFRHHQDPGPRPFLELRQTADVVRMRVRLKDDFDARTLESQLFNVAADFIGWSFGEWIEQNVALGRVEQKGCVIGQAHIVEVTKDVERLDAPLAALDSARRALLAGAGPFDQSRSAKNGRRRITGNIAPSRQRRMQFLRGMSASPGSDGLYGGSVWESNPCCQ